MKRLVGRQIFTVGKTVYRGEDVVLAGRLGGELTELDRWLRAGLAAVAASPPDEADVDDAAEAWRYERDLLAADDLDAWLDAHALSFDEWMGFVERDAVRMNGVDAGEAPATEVESVAYAEAVCSGLLGRVAYRLAGQAAIAAIDPKAPPCPKTRLRSALKVLPAGVRREGLLGLGAKETLERAEHIACLQLRFDKFVDELSAPAVLEREVETHALEWTRLECEIVTFSTEGPAREAALVVKQDGLPLSEAAALAHAPVLEERYLIEDVDPSLRDRLVGARPGQLVGPQRLDQMFILISVKERVEPSADDPTVSARARDRVVDRAVAREIDKRVRWHERF